MTATAKAMRGRYVSREKILEMARTAMQRQFEHLRKRGKSRGVRTPEEFYGFGPGDVHAIYTFKHGQGRGLWFRVGDGRVFDHLAKPAEPEPAWYETSAQ